ncbi:hypothetical protein [Actinacidiphila bryophytorum]|uniref:Uncharacterized protein n=1 Tax=Actinacidiphila bryophytorum TaxID=1436133 RepID=A0A9W4H2I9_9ACTN|nr:hypothetical protein [Actinacidiphila bryophytorum]CAG7646164.1 hypothetical protein SBRY_40342 [Actinacidiphila bryophytorum]
MARRAGGDLLDPGRRIECVFDGPSWYHGPWNSNKMCVVIGAGDADVDVGSRGNQVEVCPW